MLDHRIVDLKPKMLIGISVETTFSEFNPVHVWQKFMSRLKDVRNHISDVKYSIQVYKKQFDYSEFHPNIPFSYWAVTEVSNFNFIPVGLDSLELSGGKYAVFTHKGDMKEFQKSLKYIHLQWLPSSGYKLDHRPHFEQLDERYLGHNNPDSVEEIWIPIK